VSSEGGERIFDTRGKVAGTNNFFGAVSALPLGWGKISDFQDERGMEFLGERRAKSQGSSQVRLLLATHSKRKRNSDGPVFVTVKRRGGRKG